MLICCYLFQHLGEHLQNANWSIITGFICFSRFKYRHNPWLFRVGNLLRKHYPKESEVLPLLLLYVLHQSISSSSYITVSYLSSPYLTFVCWLPINPRTISDYTTDCITTREGRVHRSPHALILQFHSYLLPLTLYFLLLSCYSQPHFQNLQICSQFW